MFMNSSSIYTIQLNVLESEHQSCLSSPLFQKEKLEKNKISSFIAWLNLLIRIHEINSYDNSHHLKVKLVSSAFSNLESAITIPFLEIFSFPL
jgi:hypothetical protein